MFLHEHKTDNYGTNKYKATAWPYRGMERLSASKTQEWDALATSERSNVQRRTAREKKYLKKIKGRKEKWAGTRDRGTKH